ncbi:hypothetical protein LEN26_015576 [Aphanomyces euteiches]|nr:hypothetical protein LEN26_015576 [Aphanomyces euteiches]
MVAWPKVIALLSLILAVGTVEGAIEGKKQCKRDYHVCKDGSKVYRNKQNDCDFDLCPEDVDSADGGEENEDDKDVVNAKAVVFVTTAPLPVVASTTAPPQANATNASVPVAVATTAPTTTISIAATPSGAGQPTTPAVASTTTSPANHPSEAPKAPATTIPSIANQTNAANATTHIDNSTIQSPASTAPVKTPAKTPVKTPAPSKTHKPRTTSSHEYSSKTKPVTRCQTGCIEIFKPVCGSDGTTYGNACELKNAACDHAGLHVAHEGSCNNEAHDKGSVGSVESAVIVSPHTTSLPSKKPSTNASSTTSPSATSANGWTELEAAPSLVWAATYKAFSLYSNPDVCSLMKAEPGFTERLNNTYHVVAHVDCRLHGTSVVVGQFSLTFEPEEDSDGLQLTSCAFHDRWGMLQNWLIVDLETETAVCETPAQKSHFDAQPLQYAANRTTVSMAQDYVHEIVQDKTKLVGVAAAVGAFCTLAIVGMVALICRRRKNRDRYGKDEAPAQANNDEAEQEKVPLSSKSPAPDVVEEGKFQ